MCAHSKEKAQHFTASLHVNFLLKNYMLQPLFLSSALHPAGEAEKLFTYILIALNTKARRAFNESFGSLVINFCLSMAQVRFALNTFISSAKTLH